MLYNIIKWKNSRHMPALSVFSIKS